MIGVTQETLTIRCAGSQHSIGEGFLGSRISEANRKHDKEVTNLSRNTPEWRLLKDCSHRQLRKVFCGFLARFKACIKFIIRTSGYDLKGLYSGLVVVRKAMRSASRMVTGGVGRKWRQTCYVIGEEGCIVLAVEVSGSTVTILGLDVEEMMKHTPTYGTLPFNRGIDLLRNAARHTQTRPPSHENAKLADSIDSFITRLVLGIVRVSIANSIASHSPRLHDLEIAESTSNTSEPTNISGMDQGVESGCNLLWEEKTRIEFVLVPGLSKSHDRLVLLMNVLLEYLILANNPIQAPSLFSESESG
ncbi:hypothetical protein Moror_1078 [Moniliophthora roreri MCA 2997]|uniref:Uncharacterized protein n=1 Tax=Moniliophthora roreri (strain MCA 2997) TaxID=1381753 RepID=V2XHG2_MONRO|nr:hypothetical protein Moror_1078 [Moniliophthora roreri MCA 2997]